MRFPKTVPAVLLLTVALRTAAQVSAPPALQIPGEDGKPARAARLERLAIVARVHGGLAETRTTMTFRNPLNRPVAGDLVFPLPDDATVSGYALDINGRMVPGVAVPKRKARVVF